MNIAITVDDQEIFARREWLAHLKAREADRRDADAAMYRARAQFWKGKSIATQVSERIESVHSPVIGDPWNVTPNLSMTTMFAY